MKDLTECGIHHEYDFYDHDKLEKLQEKRSRKWLKLYKKFMEAREKRDEGVIEKAMDALGKHERQDVIFKEKSQQTGYYWY